MANSLGLPAVPLEPRLVPDAATWLSERFSNDDEEEVTRLEEAVCLQLAALRALRAPLPQGIAAYRCRAPGSPSRSADASSSRGTRSVRRTVQLRQRTRSAYRQASGTTAANTGLRTNLDTIIGAVDEHTNDELIDSQELEEASTGETEPRPAHRATTVAHRVFIPPRYVLPHHALIYEHTDWYRERVRLAMETNSGQYASAEASSGRAPAPRALTMFPAPAGRDRETDSSPRRSRERRFRTRFSGQREGILEDALATILFRDERTGAGTPPAAEMPLDRQLDRGPGLPDSAERLPAPLLGYREEVRSHQRRAYAQREAFGSPPTSMVLSDWLESRRRDVADPGSVSPADAMSLWNAPRAPQRHIPGRGDAALGVYREPRTGQRSLQRRSTEVLSTSVDTGRIQGPITANESAPELLHSPPFRAGSIGDDSFDAGSLRLTARGPSRARLSGHVASRTRGLPVDHISPADASLPLDEWLQTDETSGRVHGRAALHRMRRSGRELDVSSVADTFPSTSAGSASHHAWTRAPMDTARSTSTAFASPLTLEHRDSAGSSPGDFVVNDWMSAGDRSSRTDQSRGGFRTGTGSAGDTTTIEALGGRRHRGPRDPVVRIEETLRTRAWERSTSADASARASGTARAQVRNERRHLDSS